MKACKNCRFGDHAVDPQGATFYWCRFLPAHGVVASGREGQEVVWVQPPQKPNAWCGQFKLAFFRWLGNFGRRGT